MAIVYLSIGSNLEPEKNILIALERLESKVEILDISTFYITAPVNGENTPFFYNGVIKIKTLIEPISLKFDILRKVEEEIGRVRSENKNAPRTIDIDIILYDDLIINDQNLILPDSDIFERPFLAIPLAELNSELTIPGSDLNIKDIAEKMNADSMKELASFTDKLRKIVPNSPLANGKLGGMKKVMDKKSGYNIEHNSRTNINWRHHEY